jgi:two-component system sensor histidine kinase KdpD
MARRGSEFFGGITRYLLAWGAIAIVTGVLFALREVLDTTLVALLYLIPLGMITAFWGLGPGLTSALLTFLTFNYFFIKPYYEFAVHRPIDVVILVIFLIVAVVISQLVGRMQAGLSAATAREREATQLYELSTALAGMHDVHAIAQILAGQVQAVFQGEAVEVVTSGPDAISVSLPEGGTPRRKPERVIPIQAARGELGEIRLWRLAPSLARGELRLYQTFASQGALALERARLAEAEARARVLEESDRLKSAILSSVSHELRTPLSTIKAAASSLRSNEVSWDSAARPELVAAIDDATDHLNMLVGNLLDMSRIEAGAHQPKRDWNMLPEIIGSVLARMKNLTAGHTIALHLPDDLPLAPLDYVQMEQVFTNLISNSVKYAPAGSVIGIRAFADGEWLRVVVSNQGPQVPREHLERIFDKFFRITAADRVTGTGLGLSICKGIIEAHGGRIWAENIPEGLTVNFTLPLTWEGKPAPSLPPETENE